VAAGAPVLPLLDDARARPSRENEYFISKFPVSFLPAPQASPSGIVYVVLICFALSNIYVMFLSRALVPKGRSTLAP
jgi:hypothetical protein